MAAATLADPIFHIRTRNGVRSGSIFDVMAACADGSLQDLPAMRAHQRAPVVTVLAVLMCNLRRYAGSDLQGPDEWRRQWTKQVGQDALRLIAPLNEPAFMQAPVDELTDGRMGLSDVDCTFMSQGHAAKPVTTGDPEAWAFALMASIWRSGFGRGHFAAARARPVAVLVGDGSLGSEVQHLIQAYLATTSQEVGTDTVPTSTADQSYVDADFISITVFGA